MWNTGERAEPGRCRNTWAEQEYVAFDPQYKESKAERIARVRALLQRVRDREAAGQNTACSKQILWEPAVAGVFYPEARAQLSQMLDALMAEAWIQTVEGELRAIVCPHADYAFSGPVAAEAYQLLPGHSYQRMLANITGSVNEDLLRRIEFLL